MGKITGILMSAEEITGQKGCLYFERRAASLNTNKSREVI